jgi:hypothetical protein
LKKARLTPSSSTKMDKVEQARSRSRETELTPHARERENEPCSGSRVLLGFLQQEPRMSRLSAI